MRRLSASLALAAFAVAGWACQPTTQEAASAALSDADRTAIDAVRQAYADALLAADYAAVAALYTEDAMRMRSNEPAAMGRAAIQAAYEMGPGRIVSFANPSVELEGRADIAYARGTFSIDVEAEGMEEPVTDSGNWLAIFRKQADGSWLISNLSIASELPLPE